MPISTNRARLWLVAFSLVLTSRAVAQVPQVSVPQGRTAAQDAAAQRYGRSVTNDDIANAIRNSGLSQQEIRQRLQQAGLDPGLSDAFFTQGGLSPDQSAATADTTFVSALTAMGLIGPTTSATGATGGPTGFRGNQPAAPTPGVYTEELPELVFGRGVFARRTTLFDPVSSGPIDASYRLGVGDQLQVVLTGEVEAAYALEVRRDGSVILPQVGRVALAGLTLESGRALLRQRGTRVYSGLASGKVVLDLSVSQVHTNQVYVLGEVEAPGAYQVTALGTAFHAIARAGGPTLRGSFRQVQVRRGGQLLRTVDLYPYLLSGDGSVDLRTEQGDILYVPLATRQVEVRGLARRPSLYELKDDEGFADLLRFAGGLQSTASTDRVSIDRILPTEQRTPGHDRAVVDVRFNGDLAALDTVKLYDGDIVTVFPVTDLRRNRVTLTGEVYQPGVFEWTPGMRLGDVMHLAQGPKPWALTDRIKVVRPIMQTGRATTFSVNFDSAGGPGFELQEFDSLTVLDGRLIFPAGPVQILGAVNRPGRSRYVEHQTLQDLIDMAGGLKEQAASLEVARRRVGEEYSDTTAVVQRFAVDPTTLTVPGASTYVLDRYDIVTVRESPGFRNPSTVALTGLFSYPGTYTILKDGERLSSVIQRAGGLLPTAFTESFRLVRGGKPVAIDLAKALRGDRLQDIALEPDDQLSVGPNPNVVAVTGAVQRQVVIPYNRGWSMSDYIEAAGGLADNGNGGKRYVEYASGGIGRRGGFLIFHTDPGIRPGAKIVVPEKPPETNGSNFGELFAMTFQVVGTLASLTIAYLAATK